MYEIECVLCISTAPVLVAEASQTFTKGIEKLASVRTGGEVRASFRFTRACWVVFVHGKAFFLVIVVRDAANEL